MTKPSAARSPMARWIGDAGFGKRGSRLIWIHKERTWLAPHGAAGVDSLSSRTQRSSSACCPGAVRAAAQADRRDGRDTVALAGMAGQSRTIRLRAADERPLKARIPYRSRADGPLNLPVDSTAIKFIGEGAGPQAWCQGRCPWRKVHLAMDTATPISALSNPSPALTTTAPCAPGISGCAMGTPSQQVSAMTHWSLAADLPSMLVRSARSRAEPFARRQLSPFISRMLTPY